MQLLCVKFVAMGIIRRTKSVETLLSVFEKGQHALSAIDLVERLKNKMNKTTVYRILERMEQDGIVHAFNDVNGLKWYAKCNGCSSEHHVDTHPHFQCKDCGTMECLSIDISIPHISNLQIDTAKIMLVGKCTQCLS